MSGDVMDELNASGELWPEPKTEDGAATTPRADQTGRQVLQHLGPGSAAESATGAPTPEAAPSSHAARQEAGLEGNGGDGDDEGVGTG